MQNLGKIRSHPGTKTGGEYKNIEVCFHGEISDFVFEILDLKFQVYDLKFQHSTFKFD